MSAPSDAGGHGLDQDSPRDEQNTIRAIGLRALESVIEACLKARRLGGRSRPFDWTAPGRSSASSFGLSRRPWSTAPKIRAKVEFSFSSSYDRFWPKAGISWPVYRGRPEADVHGDPIAAIALR